MMVQQILVSKGYEGRTKPGDCSSSFDGLLDEEGVLGEVSL